MIRASSGGRDDFETLSDLRQQRDCQRHAADKCDGSAGDECSPLEEDHMEAIIRYCRILNQNDRDGYGGIYTPDPNGDISNKSSTTVPLCVLGEVQLRFLCPDDLEEVRALCQEWFPISKFILFISIYLTYIILH